MMKKVYSLLLSFVMVLGVMTSVPVTVNAASEYDLGFELNNDGASYSVTDCYYAASGEMRIPDKYNGLPVVSIDDMAFSGCYNLTSITIPDSVTSIGDYAFDGCKSLTSITIPDSVTGIGDWAFHDCTRLTTITIPDSVTNIGSNAFYYCTSLTSVSMGNSVTSIGAEAFSNCTRLTSITIPDRVTGIGKSAFSYCTSLTSVSMGNSVTSIGDYAFDGCASIRYVFYGGTEDEWSRIKFGSYNSNMTGSKIHYESTDHTVSDWILDRTATIYYPGLKHNECTVCKVALEYETIPQLKCSTPKLKSVTNLSNGIKFTWNKVTGAVSYVVYRKTTGGWKRIAENITATSYTDKTAKNGTTYKYTVRAKNGGGLSGYNSTGLSLRKLAVPKLYSVTNASSGVTVKWGKVTGASGYYVYRKTGNGSWSKIATVKGNTKVTYTDKTAKAGKTYTYTVKAYYGKSVSSYNTKGLSIRRLLTTKITSAVSNREGILIKWNKVTGASGYYVYRKSTSGDWKKIATVKGNTKIKYLDETPRKSVTYQYRVKAYYGKYVSAYSNAFKVKCKY